MDPLIAAALIGGGVSLLGGLFGGSPKSPKMPNPVGQLISQPMDTPQPPPTQYAPPQVVPPHKVGIGPSGGMNAAMERALSMLQRRQ